MNQEESEHSEVDGMKKEVDSKGEVMHVYCGDASKYRRILGIPVSIFVHAFSM